MFLPSCNSLVPSIRDIISFSPRSLEANKDQVVMSRKLVELVYEAPVANLDSLEFGPVNASVSETQENSIQHPYKTITQRVENTATEANL